MSQRDFLDSKNLKHYLEEISRFPAVTEEEEKKLGESIRKGDQEAIQSLVKALKEREEIMSTGIGFGIAIPHAKIGTINEMAFAIGIARGRPTRCGPTTKRGPGGRSSTGRPNR